MNVSDSLKNVRDVFSERGHEIHPVADNVLHGFFQPILGSSYSAEVIGDEEGGVIMQLATMRWFQEDQRETIASLTERMNQDPKYGAGDSKWLKIGPTVTSRTGGFRVCLVAKIEADQPNLTTPEHSREKVGQIISAVAYFELAWGMSH